MPMKPTKQGYKAWCLCDSVNGYMYNIDIYTGKVSIGLTTNSDDGLATRVVKSITEPLYGKGHHIYMDKFLGAATGSPYIVFISTSGMLRSSDIYIYIYILCVPTHNRNNEFIL